MSSPKVRKKAPKRNKPPAKATSRLQTLLEAIHIESPTSIKFANLPPLTVEAVATLPQQAIASTSAHPLTSQLATLIYYHGYASELTSKGVQDTHANPSPLADSVAFIEKVSAANSTQNRIDPGWKIYRSDADGKVHVEKKGTYRLAAPGQYLRTEGFHRSIAVGDKVQLLVHRESRDIQAGFLYFFGDTLTSDHDDALISRFYFNTTSENVAWLVEELSTALNRFGVPFRLKCLTDPAQYNRQDAVVCYVAKQFLTITLRIFALRQKALADHLLPGAPLFTKELLPGLGAADEPGGGKSFGQSRSELVANGIVEAWTNNDQSTEGRIAAITNQFLAQNLNFNSPHCSEGQIDLYFLPSC